MSGLRRADTEHTTRREHGEHRRSWQRRGDGLPGRRGVPGGEREVTPGPRAPGRGRLGVHLEHGAQQRPQPVGGVPAGTVEPIVQLRLIDACDFVGMYFRFPFPRYLSCLLLGFVTGTVYSTESKNYQSQSFGKKRVFPSTVVTVSLT